MLDAVIVGAGPAGLSAALLLGRCRRRVVVCDAGRPRNAASRGLHGFLSREGIAPAELLAIGREQLRPYRSVEVREAEVVAAACIDGGFALELADGDRLVARKLLLATGLVDEVPPIEGIAALYGRSVHHCPYCDGWEWRDRPLAAYGRGASGRKMAARLTAWSDDVILCTDGPAGLGPRGRAALDRLGITVREEPIARLEGQDGRLRRIVFARGAPLERSALFFNTVSPQRSKLAEALRCGFTPEGGPKVGKHQATDVPGLYVAGDASRDVQFAIVAASEGATAAVGIHSALLAEDLARAGSAAALRS